MMVDCKEPGGRAEGGRRGRMGGRKGGRKGRGGDGSAERGRARTGRNAALDGKTWNVIIEWGSKSSVLDPDPS